MLCQNRVFCSNTFSSTSYFKLLQSKQLVINDKKIELKLVHDEKIKILKGRFERIVQLGPGLNRSPSPKVWNTKDEH